MKTLSFKRWLLANLSLLILTLLVLVGAAMVGGKFLPIFGWRNLSPEERDILLVSRLPRVLLAAVTGMALGSSGTAFQGLLQNSLADPYILGVSSGAALGTIVGLAFGLPFQVIPVISFSSSVIAMFLVYTTASTRRQISPHKLLLTGVILNAFLFAFILILNGLVSFEQSQRMLFLLIGNLEAESYGKIFFVACLVLAGLVSLTREGYALNLISGGADSASVLGIDVHRRRRRIFFAASLMIGAVVPLAGLIGFIGLFVPHMTRMIVGPDHRLSIPASGWIGAILLILCDTIARTILVSGAYQTEIPVGAVTAVVGAPFFLILLKRGRR